MKLKIFGLVSLLSLLSLAATVNIFKNELRITDAAGIKYLGFKPPSSLTASKTFTLPDGDGSSAQYLGTNGSGTLSWQTVPSSNNAYELTNVGVSATLSSNTLIVALKQADGSTDPTTGSPAYAAFRSATQTTGGYSRVSFTAAASVTLGTTASLGFTSGSSGTLFAYLVNDSTNEVCVAGAQLDESALYNATATPSTSPSTLYCPSAHTSRPIRAIGMVVATWTSGTGWTARASAYPWVSLGGFKSGGFSLLNGSFLTQDGAFYSTTATSGRYNWLFGGNYNLASTFEITPSTATNGTTFSTPAFQVGVSSAQLASTSAMTLKLQAAGSSGNQQQIYFLNAPSSGKYNFAIGNQIIASNEFEIIPSTAVDGTTFSTPGLKIDNAGNTTVSGTFTASNKITVGSLPTFNEVISSSSGSYSTTSGTPVDVTNLSVTITTNGRPVEISLVSDGDTTSSGTTLEHYCSVYGAGSANMYINLLRGGTFIDSVATAAVNTPCSSVRFRDAPSAGTYTYKIQVFMVSGTGGVTYAKLWAHEL